MAWQYKFIQPWDKYNQYITDSGDAPGSSTLQLLPQDEALYNAILNYVKIQPLNIVTAGVTTGLVTKDKNPDGVTPALIRRLVWILRQEYPQGLFNLQLIQSIPFVHVYNQPNDFWDSARGVITTVFSTAGNAIAPGAGSFVASSVAANANTGPSTAIDTSRTAQLSVQKDTANASGPSTSLIVGGIGILALGLLFVIAPNLKNKSLNGIKKKKSKK